MENLGASFNLSAKPVWITENIVTSGEIPFRNTYENVDPKLYVKEDGKLRPDSFSDDMALAVKTGLGLVIILGCAHRGMINTINHFQEITGDDRVYAIIGGTHLISASSERLIQTIADLKKIGIQK